MEHVFKAEVLVGKADAGYFSAIHDTPKLNSAFSGYTNGAIWEWLRQSYDE